ncbi:unnamed protein product, partial [Musa textilis]
KPLRELIARLCRSFALRPIHSLPFLIVIVLPCRLRYRHQSDRNKKETKKRLGDGRRQWPEVEDGAREEHGEEQSGQGKPAGIEQEGYDHPVSLCALDTLLSRKFLFIVQCKVCMQTFMCTTSEVKCREHAEAKHPKSDVSQCFPHLKK